MPHRLGVLLFLQATRNGFAPAVEVIQHVLLSPWRDPFFILPGPTSHLPVSNHIHKLAPPHRIGDDRATITTVDGAIRGCFFAHCLYGNSYGDQRVIHIFTGEHCIGIRVTPAEKKSSPTTSDSIRTDHSCSRRRRTILER